MKFNFKNAQNRGTLPKTVGHVEMAQISIVNKINQWNLILKICPKPWDFALNRGTRENTLKLTEITIEFDNYLL